MKLLSRLPDCGTAKLPFLEDNVLYKRGRRPAGEMKSAE
jgi:hypothetical protein